MLLQVEFVKQGPDVCVCVCVCVCLCVCVCVELKVVLCLDAKGKITKRKLSEICNRPHKVTLPTADNEEEEEEKKERDQRS